MDTIKPLDPDRQSEHKFCIFARGGLGDTIKRYFGEERHGDGWEYLIPLKEKYPDAIIKLITFSANSQTPHFHKYHPLIDEIYQDVWRHPGRPCNRIEEVKGDDYQLIKNSQNQDVNLSVVDGLTPVKQTRLYLSPEDQEFVNHISYVGPYVVLHPFAGGASRIMMPVEEYYPLARGIINRGLSVVVVGANWKKPTTYYPAHSVEEEFHYKQPGIINLIDRANPRVVAGLVMKSTCLISVRSYCFALTKSNRVKSILLVSHPKSKTKTYFTPNQTRNNLLDPLFGWDEETVDKKIKLVGADFEYPHTRRAVLAHLDSFLGN